MLGLAVRRRWCMAAEHQSPGDSRLYIYLVAFYTSYSSPMWPNFRSETIIFLPPFNSRLTPRHFFDEIFLFVMSRIFDRDIFRHRNVSELFYVRNLKKSQKSRNDRMWKFWENEKRDPEGERRLNDNKVGTKCVVSSITLWAMKM